MHRGNGVGMVLVHCHGAAGHRKTPQDPVAGAFEGFDRVCVAARWVHCTAAPSAVAAVHAATLGRLDVYWGMGRWHMPHST